MNATTIIAYTFAADAYCAECAGNAFDAESLANGSAEFNGNPVGVMFAGEEMDTPLHCGGCGAFIEGHQLTEEGRAYVMDAFQDDTGGSDPETVVKWAEAYDYLLDAMYERGWKARGVDDAYRRLNNSERAAIDAGDKPRVRMDSEECGCCLCWHRHAWAGDCRQDNEAFMECDNNEAECFDAATGTPLVSRATEMKRQKAEAEGAAEEFEIVADGGDGGYDDSDYFDRLESYVAHILQEMFPSLPRPDGLEDPEWSSEAVEEAISAANEMLSEHDRVISWHSDLPGVLVAGTPRAWASVDC